MDALSVATLALNTVGTVFAIIGACAGWWFVYRYARPPHHWRRWLAGRHLMRMTFALAAILTYVVIFQAVTYLIEPNPWIDLAVRLGRLAIFAGICSMLVERVLLLRTVGDEPERLLTPVDDGDGQTAQTH